jgi:hypothetical protein
MSNPVRKGLCGRCSITTARSSPKPVGAARASLTYQKSVSFPKKNGGVFGLFLLSSDALGKGFDSAFFEILLNGILVDGQSFTDLASAEAFFSANANQRLIVGRV